MNLQERAYLNGKYTFRLALERAKRYNAFPRWANNREERKKILEIYIAAQYKNLTTRKRWQVDHIIPLYGHNVCGLHVSTNLRIISKQSNQAKSNTFIPFIEKAGKRKKLNPLVPLPETPSFSQKAPRKGKKNPTKKSLQKMAKKVIFRKRNFWV